MEFAHTLRIAYLIFRRFTDTLTEQENVELEEWLASGEQNARLMEEICRRNFLSEKQMQEQLYHSEDAFRKVQLKYHHHKRFRVLYRSIAAVLVLTLGIAIAIQFPRQTTQLATVPVHNLSAGVSKATLTFASGQRMELGQKIPDTIVLQEGVRLNVSGKEIEYNREEKKSADGFNVLEVPRKGEFKLILSDGTKVWINSASRLKFPVCFSGNERRVLLEGEAYFEVSKNPALPFVVDMGKVTIQVLGTSFNARAYREESNIYATLTEGSILLADGQQRLVLHPDEQGIADLNQGQLFKQEVDSRLYTAWKDGRFTFQEQSLEEMMNTLSRWYDIQVFFENDSVRNTTFTGNLKRYDSFNKIIELLEMTGIAHFRIYENTIFISEIKNEQ